MRMRKLNLIDIRRKAPLHTNKTRESMPEKERTVSRILVGTDGFVKCRKKENEYNSHYQQVALSSPFKI